MAKQAPKEPKAEKSSPSQPLAYVDLSGLYRVNGSTASQIVYDPDRINMPGSNVYRAKSLEHFGSRICVDGIYWIPANSGVVSGWVERARS